MKNDYGRNDFINCLKSKVQGTMKDGCNQFCNGANSEGREHHVKTAQADGRNPKNEYQKNEKLALPT